MSTPKNIHFYIKLYNVNNLVMGYEIIFRDTEV